MFVIPAMWENKRRIAVQDSLAKTQNPFSKVNKAGVWDFVQWKSVCLASARP
jgi:hypothetical protein